MLTLRFMILAALVRGIPELHDKTLRQAGASLAAFSLEELQAEVEARTARVRRMSVDADGALEVYPRSEVPTAATREGRKARKGRPMALAATGYSGDALTNFPDDFDCTNWQTDDGKLLLEAVRIKLIVPGSTAWDRTKPLSNCDCMQHDGGEFVGGECICRMVSTASDADYSDISLSEHGSTTYRAASWANTTRGDGDPKTCAMSFKWSQYGSITQCQCQSCSFAAGDDMFISQCGACTCAPGVTTQCIPGFFSIADKSKIDTWEKAGDYFEGDMCTYRGSHPIEMCKKMRCEVFGGGDSGSDACSGAMTWVNVRAPGDPFEPSPVYCKILDVLKEAHFAHHTGVAENKDPMKSEAALEGLYESDEYGTLKNNDPRKDMVALGGHPHHHPHHHGGRPSRRVAECFEWCADYDEPMEKKCKFKEPDGFQPCGGCRGCEQYQDEQNRTRRSGDDPRMPEMPERPERPGGGSGPTSAPGGGGPTPAPGDMGGGGNNPTPAPTDRGGGGNNPTPAPGNMGGNNRASLLETSMTAAVRHHLKNTAGGRAGRMRIRMAERTMKSKSDYYYYR